MQVLTFSNWFSSQPDETEMSVLRKKVNWSRLGLSTCQRSQQQQTDRDPSSCTRLYWGKKAFPGRLEMYLHKYNNDIPSSSCNRSCQVTYATAWHIQLCPIFGGLENLAIHFFFLHFICSTFSSAGILYWYCNQVQFGSVSSSSLDL